MVCNYWFGFGNKGERVSISAYPEFIQTNPAVLHVKIQALTVGVSSVPHLTLCINHLQADCSQQLGPARSQ